MTLGAFKDKKRGDGKQNFHVPFVRVLTFVSLLFEYRAYAFALIAMAAKVITAMNNRFILFLFLSV